MSLGVAETPFRKMVPMTTHDTDQIAIGLDDLNESLGRVRTARKPWRCVCAERLRGIVIETHWTHRDGTAGGTGFKSSNAKALAEGEAEAAALIGAVAAWNVNVYPHEPSGWYDEARAVERLNPNHRPDCLGDIAVGDRYFEYLGESMMWESGSRYCARCAVAVWAGKS